MGVMESLAGFENDASCLHRVNLLSVGGVMQWLSCYILHHDEGHAVDFTKVIDPNQIGVV